jgi:hypothetical protein
MAEFIAVMLLAAIAYWVQPYVAAAIRPFID